MSDHSREQKRELIKQYQKEPKQMGVYCIRNKTTDQRYVAASRDIKARFNRHRFELQTGLERLSEALQQDWTEQGPGNFEFEILEELAPLDDTDYDPADDLETLEAMWLEKLAPYVPAGYNPPVA